MLFREFDATADVGSPERAEALAQGSACIAAEAARYLGMHVLEVSFGTVFWKGVLAGALVAGMVRNAHYTTFGT